MAWGIQDFGAMGEIVGGIGVIASLIYLGTQIRFSTKSTNAESFRQLMTAMREVLARADRLGLWIEKWLDGDRSTIVELNLKVEMRLVLDSYHAVWISMDSGSTDENLARDFIQRWLGYTFSWSILRDIWRLMEGEYDPKFVQFVNSYLSQNANVFTEAQQKEFIRDMNAVVAATNRRHGSS